MVQQFLDFLFLDTILEKFPQVYMHCHCVWSRIFEEICWVLNLLLTAVRNNSYTKFFDLFGTNQHKIHFLISVDVFRKFVFILSFLLQMFTRYTIPTFLISFLHPYSIILFSASFPLSTFNPGL